MKQELWIAPAGGIAFRMRAGETAIVTDVEGKQVADFFAVSEPNSQEFLSAGATMDCIESIYLNGGDTVYTNWYRPMFTVLRDDVGNHDLIHPSCRPEMFAHFYHADSEHKNCYQNISENMELLGASRQQEIHPLNLFMHTPIREDGRFTVEEPRSKAGDSVALRAEMDVIVGLSACAVSESKCNGYRCTPIKVVIEG